MNIQYIIVYVLMLGGMAAMIGLAINHVTFILPKFIHSMLMIISIVGIVYPFAFPVLLFDFLDLSQIFFSSFLFIYSFIYLSCLGILLLPTYE